MSSRRLSAFVVSLVLAGPQSIGVVAAADALSDLKPGTKVIADVGGESAGEVVEKVAPNMYRVRVKIRTGDVIEPVLPAERLRLADAPSAASATPGTATSGTVTPGTVAPGTVTGGTVTPGKTSATITQGAVRGSVTVTPGTVIPGRVTPGTVTPGTVTQGTTPPIAISQGVATPGTVTSGKVTAGTVVPGTATAGTATSGTVVVKPGTVTTTSSEVPILETPEGKANLQSMAGSWDVVSALRNNRLDSQAAKTITITPTSIVIGEQLFEYVRVDPTSNPRRIDIAKVADGPLLRGIFKQEGDTLRICLMDAEVSIRPTDFSTAQDDSRILFECRRRK